MASSSSSNAITGIYRKLHILERRVSFRPANNAHGERFLQNYLRYRFHAPVSSKTEAPSKKLAKRFLDYRNSLQSYTDLLVKYKILNPMEEREYVRRQAAHVGLQLPQFSDMKQDSEEYVVKTSPPLSMYEEEKKN